MAPKRRFDGMPFVTLKNIRRLEKHGHGWRVHIKRGRKEYPKYFPDGWDGPFESLRLAIAWRDQMWRELGAPTHVPKKATRRSSTGILGVAREIGKSSNGGLSDNYRAKWTTATGKVGRRSFSVRKYGKAEAERLAIEAYQAGEAEAAKQRERRLLDVLHTHRSLIGELPADPSKPVSFIRRP